MCLRLNEPAFLRIPYKRLPRDINHLHACRRAAAPIAFARVPASVGFQPVAVAGCSAVEFYYLVGHLVRDGRALKRTAIQKTVLVDSMALHVVPIWSIVAADRFDRFFFNLRNLC